MNGVTRTLTIVSIVGAGVVAGLFFAFSVAIMRSLEQLPPAQGLAAMQVINVRIVNPLFLLFFLGSAVTCLALMVVSFVGDAPGRWWRVAGAVVFLIGAIGVTVVVNVPLNDSLAAVDPAGAHAAETWHKYLADWVPPNHVRTIASILATALLALGLPHGAPDQEKSAAYSSAQPSQSVAGQPDPHRPVRNW
jgi:uncharacterized membrane protein